MQRDELRQSRDSVQTQARHVYAALSNRYSLRIFDLAAKGIDVSKDTSIMHELSKKRYHVRLKELVELGLVTKEKGEYRHTSLGSIIYENQVTSLQRILLKKGSLEILNELSMKNQSDENLRAAISDLSSQLLKDLETSIGLSNLKPIRLLRTWNEFSTYSVSLIDAMAAEASIATRRMDFKIADSALRAAQRGCKVSIIHSNRRIETSQIRDDIMSRQDATGMLNELRTNSNILIRRGTIPYSFSVIDRLDAAIEIANPNDPESFFIGVGLQATTLAAKLGSYFEEIGSMIMN